MKVFISYSHNDVDTPLARHLAERLRAIGIDVWQDESSHPAVGALGDDLEKAILDSDHAILIVSKLWLASGWCQVESDRLYKRDHSKVRRVIVFRRSPDELRLPREIIGLTGVVWPEDEAHHDARFWEVYCALVGKAPGPVEQWAAESAKLAPASGSPLPQTPIARTTGPSIESLRCNRGLQWNRVTDVEPELSHDVLIVPGESGQAHDHFSQRIRELLTPAPPRSIVSIHWRKRRPASRDEFFAALAEDLEVSIDMLKREMAERMSDSNLVLLHPCLRSLYIDAPLISYYTEWLPSLLGEVKPRMSLKSVQPVEWPPSEGGVAAMMTWLRLKRPVVEEGKPEAEKFIERIQTGAAPALRAIRLQELSDITDADLDEFCQIQKLTATQKAWFLSRISARNPRNSEEKLEAIDAFLADARSVS